MLRKLRVGLLVGAALLVAVVVGFVLYGRMMQLRFKLALPKKLGLNISQESHVVTLSRSVKGKTVFTVHAADQVQQNNGMIELHDVGIELFGRQDGHSDKISGKDFLFDQKKGIMTGVGEVLIDLAEPSGANPPPVRQGQNPEPEKRVHVRTTGLVFNQNEQTAESDGNVEFSANGMTGTSVGASYDAKNGVVDLKSDVHVSGLQAGNPVVVTALWAELQRPKNLVLLRGAKYTVVGSSGAQSVAADQAQVHITPQGQPQAIDGQGHVVLTGSGRGTLTGTDMTLALTGAGKPRAGRVWGGVVFHSDEPGRTAQGTAREVQLAFNPAGEPMNGSADGDVVFHQQAPGVTRALHAARVEMTFANAVKGRSSLRDAVASGSAALRMTGSGLRGQTLTEVSGDTLHATFVPVTGRSSNGHDQISTLDGTGHTVVHQLSATGADQTSRGDTLAVTFKPAPSGKASSQAQSQSQSQSQTQGQSQIERAIQRGTVTLVRSAPPKKPGDPVQVEHASAAEAIYEGDGERLRLNGGAQLTDASSVLLADSVELQRETGDSTADGNVRLTYTSGDPRAEPLHLTAARAVERKSAGTADFYGVPGRDARMWQQGSQVEAPVLTFLQDGKDQATRRMIAHGAPNAGPETVRAVLTSTPQPNPKDKSTGSASNGPTSNGPVRITARQMTYTDAARTVEFSGSVKARNQDGSRLQAEKAIAYLSRSPAPSQSAASSTPGPIGGLSTGKLERLIATGSVVIEQPGRTGTGEQLVYTAADQLYVLTGTTADPPRVVDEEHGTTTGAALRFVSGEDRVTIVGDASQKVRSTTQIRGKGPK